MSDINLYNMDCMEAMKEMEDNSFDLAIVDPPYGIGDFRRGTSRDIHRVIEWNNNVPGLEYFEELKRISKKRIIFGANYMNCFAPGGALVWHKQICPTTMSQCEIASISFQNKVDFCSIELKTGFRDPYRIHPCQKPTELYRWILQKYGTQGDTILDTHLGSGSIAIACHDLGFNLTGYELDTKYFEAAKKRLTEHQNQIDLFSGINLNQEPIQEVLL